MAKLYLLIHDDYISDIGWGWFSDDEEGWNHIENIVKDGCGYTVIRGEIVKSREFGEDDNVDNS